MKKRNNIIIRPLCNIAIGILLFITATFSCIAIGSNNTIDDQKLIVFDLIKSEKQEKTRLSFLDYFIHDWNWWEDKPNMFAIPSGSIGIGGVPPSYAKLYVKTNNSYEEYAIFADGGKGIKSVSTILDGTGITGEGGHAGVCGNGYIGLLGFGYYGGWFEGKGYFSGNVGIGTIEMENKLHIDGGIQLDPISEPENPSSGFVIYCDVSDGLLKAKASTGTITILANS